MSCEKCGGTGKLRYDIAPSGEARRVGDVIIEDRGGSGTRACPCVRDLPAVDGHAKWWESETIHSAVVDVPIFQECVEIEATCEVPRAENGQRVHRTAENAYYPPLVEVQTPEKLTLHSDTARELATALIAAADACDRADALADATRAPDGYQAAAS